MKWLQIGSDILSTESTKGKDPLRGIDKILNLVTNAARGA
jgi:hypothetical protein